MANYSTLKAAVADAVKTNGTQAITGANLQAVLLSIINSVGGGGYIFKGVATPSTDAGTPDENVFYIGGAGTYANFGTSVSVPVGSICVFKYNGSWVKEQIALFAGIDDVPTAGSDNLVKSGGVYEKISQLRQQVIYDVTANNADAKFASLSALLSSENLSTLIPIAVRCGGMSIKFVQSSDNKYVQYRLMSDEWSINTEDWAIADDGVYVDNPEFVRVVLDNDNKILEAIRVDGTKLLPSGVEVNEKIYFEGNEITIIENPEFIEAKLDSAGHILWAIKTDGDIYYGAGVPQQVVDYINKRIAELSLDEYEDIVAFLNNLEKGDKNLQTLLNEKVDKEEGKSLIDADYASSQSAIDNPEYLQVTTDSEDKILEGIKQDGTKVIGGDLNVGGSTNINGDIRVLGNMEVSGVSYKVIENPEYLAAWVDAEDKVIFGLKTDGKIYIGYADFLDAVKDWDALSSITAVENPEFIEAKTDSEGRLLAGRTTDGAAFENVGFTTPKVSIDGTIIENIEDLEGRSEITTDAEGKIISYRDGNGVRHEEVGLEANTVVAKSSTFGSIDFDTEEHKEDFINSLNIQNDKIKIRRFDLPKNGTVNIVSETFYLTANEGYSDLSGVYPIQVYENNDENAWDLKVCQVYYVKSTLTDNGDGTYSVNENSVALDFYAASKITKVGTDYYVTSTLVDGQPVETSIRVTQLIDVPNVQAWPVDKKTEHYCTVEINFGDYLSGTFYVGVKFQGSSTLHYRKRNFRFTFYKNSSYSKKLKLKIGEIVRLSGFNLKSYYRDNTRMREYLLNKVFTAMWEDRPNAKDWYPWNETEGYYTGATGMIKSFPVYLTLGNEFYGLEMFGTKKDEKNYMLDGDDDSSGIFVSGEAGINAYNARGWADEMGADGEKAFPDWEDSVTVETADAINQFFDFVLGRLYEDANHNTYAFEKLTDMNGVYYVTETLTDNGDGTYSINSNSIQANTLIEFNRETAKERLSIIDWIDYLIGLETFYLPDNTIHNVILYTGRDKKKFFPFFYDMDSALYIRDNEKDVFSEWNPENSINNNPLWTPIYETFKDDITNRFRYLCSTVINNNYLTKVLDDAYANFPKEWLAEEQEKWGSGGIKLYGDVSYVDSRTIWLKNNIFILNN